jgi:hypothetical protein
MNNEVRVATQDDWQQFLNCTPIQADRQPVDSFTGHQSSYSSLAEIRIRPHPASCWVR